MNSLEEMKRFAAIRYLHNLDRMTRIVRGNCSTIDGQVEEDENFLRLLDEKFACCENHEQERIRAEEIKEGKL